MLSIYIYAREKMDLFMKRLYSNSLIKLDSFYVSLWKQGLVKAYKDLAQKKLYSVESHVLYQLYLLEDYR